MRNGERGGMSQLVTEMMSDRDMRRLETELITVAVAAHMTATGCIGMLQLEIGIGESLDDVVRRVRRLEARGRGDEARARLDRLSSRRPEAQELLQQIRDCVEAELAEQAAPELMQMQMH